MSSKTWERAAVKRKELTHDYQDWQDTKIKLETQAAFGCMVDHGRAIAEDVVLETLILLVDMALHGLNICSGCSHDKVGKHRLGSTK